MNVRSAATGAVVFACLFGTAQAAELTGGDVTLGYSAFTKDADFRALSLEGAVEFGITPQFGVEVDLAYRDFGVSDENGSNLTLHGIYHLNDDTALGLFYGRDWVSGEHADYLGLEARSTFDAFRVEGYAAHGDSEGEKATFAGLSGGYALNDAFSIETSIDYVSFEDGASLRRVGLRGEYAFAPRVSAYAEVGSVRVADQGFSDSETFVGVGASFALGDKKGATFGSRGILKITPGS
ncbi:porin [Oceaniglobus trochenteri]|uniref:porin n=1 Tax=Oceaniglobus trochenteri TaxID=2763260 RepID=UPI001CFFF314|nr:porin [Oceaniglobus trochenteri]